MREIDNNIANRTNVNFQGVQPSSKEITEVSQSPETTETKETTDLNKMPSGRSQVPPQSSLKSDIAFFTGNPETVEKANKMFDFLVDKKGYNYEQATEIVNAAITEFSL